MNRRNILLLILILAGVIYFTFSCRFYLDRKFHEITYTPGPSISVEFIVNTVGIDEDSYDFDPPLTFLERIPEDSSTNIVTIKEIGDKGVGLSFTYHRPLVDTATMGRNPSWAKRHVLEILFYRKDSTAKWALYSQTTHIIDKYLETGEMNVNSSTAELFEEKQKYSIGFDYKVQ